MVYTISIHCVGVMIRSIYLVVVMLCATHIPFLFSSAHADTYHRQEGINIIHYKFDLSINYELRIVQGIAFVKYVCTSAIPLSRLEFDFVGGTVTKVLIDGEPITFKRSRDKLSVPLPTRTSSDVHIIEIQYETSPRA